VSFTVHQDATTVRQGATADGSPGAASRPPRGLLVTGAAEVATLAGGLRR
jgi:hypothetical protein